MEINDGVYIVFSEGVIYVSIEVPTSYSKWRTYKCSGVISDRDSDNQRSFGNTLFLDGDIRIGNLFAFHDVDGVRLLTKHELMPIYRPLGDDFSLFLKSVAVWLNRRVMKLFTLPNDDAHGELKDERDFMVIGSGLFFFASIGIPFDVTIVGVCDTSIRRYLFSCFRRHRSSSSRRAATH